MNDDDYCKIDAMLTKATRSLRVAPLMAVLCVRAIKM